MRPMDFDGCIMTSPASIHDWTYAIARRFFFTREVAKAGRSIFDRTGVVNNSHPSVSCEPLIEYEEPNPTATPNFAYKYTYSSMM